MKCPFCLHPNSRVTDSRTTHRGTRVRRRRECTHCSRRFTTYEMINFSLPKVIKANGRVEPFEREKLLAGMRIALSKRPVTADQLDAAVSRIEKQLLALDKRKVRSRQIGELAMEELKRLDQVAYVRFASVYRQFEDVDAFRNEIDQLR